MGKCSKCGRLIWNIVNFVGRQRARHREKFWDSSIFIRYVNTFVVEFVYGEICLWACSSSFRLVMLACYRNSIAIIDVFIMQAKKEESECQWLISVDETTIPKWINSAGLSCTFELLNLSVFSRILPKFQRVKGQVFDCKFLSTSVAWMRFVELIIRHDNLSLLRFLVVPFGGARCEKVISHLKSRSSIHPNFTLNKQETENH